MVAEIGYINLLLSVLGVLVLLILEIFTCITKLKAMEIVEQYLNMYL